MTKFEQDKIGREEIVNRICLLVDNLQKDQHFCLALNGEWGSGKSFVLDMVEEKLEQRKEYIIIKYDAWANSFYSDPLIAILSCLIDGVQEKLKEIKGYKKAIKEIAKEKGVSLLEELSQKTGKLGTVASIIKSIIGVIPKFQNAHSFEENNNIVDFKSYQQLLGEIKENLNTLTAYREYRGKQTKLIILVDEIDRCLPDEQLKILERLHHLFDVKNCAVICALNKKCIASSFEKFYANNGYQYLRKFFDYTITLNMNEGIYLKTILVELIDQPIVLNSFKGDEQKGKEFLTNISGVILCSIKNNKILMDNRNTNRYYHSLIKIFQSIESKGLKLRRRILFFIIIGLYLKRFISPKFLEEQSGVKFVDYVEQLKCNAFKKDKSQDSFVAQYKDNRYNYFNNIANYCCNKESHSPEYWHKNLGDIRNIAQTLRQEILLYGGQNETNER